jgi:riboflavin kinase / FMN adenylyltransferase
MRVMRHYLDVPADARGAAVALGNFDGVHRGHHAVVSAARHAASHLGAPLGVVTFDPSPRSFFNPRAPSGQITSLDQKIERLAAIGVQFVYALRFDQVMAATSPDQFVSAVLHRGIAARHVVTGHDYRFGRNRTGDIATLGQLCRDRDIAFTPVAPAGSDGAIFSSTAIRDALRRGAPEDAAHILGRPWEICAPLELVQSDGQKLFPTAVVRIGHYLRPAQGAYAVVVHDERGWRCDRACRRPHEFAPGSHSAGIVRALPATARRRHPYRLSQSRSVERARTPGALFNPTKPKRNGIQLSCRHASFLF